MCWIIFGNMKINNGIIIIIITNYCAHWYANVLKFLDILKNALFEISDKIKYGKPQTSSR